jgi:hypothetical protein
MTEICGILDITIDDIIIYMCIELDTLYTVIEYNLP